MLVNKIHGDWVCLILGLNAMEILRLEYILYLYITLYRSVSFEATSFLYLVFLFEERRLPPKN